MEGEDVPDPLELSKNLKVIKAAQEETARLDILVCGECQDVFHHLEGFQEHKQGENCPKTSKSRENHNLERKAQIWGFMLWKNAQTKVKTEGESETSWMIYQRWCKLDSEEKNAWVVAGQTVLSFTKIGAAKMQEVNCKTPPMIKNKVIKPKTNDDEPLEEGEIRLSQLTNAQRIAIKAQVASNKANVDADPLVAMDDSEVDGKEVKKLEVKKVPLKPVQVNVNKSAELRKVLCTGKDDSIVEAVAERILSRRFNHKKRYMEYCVKWEHMNESEITWEPKIHFDKCKWMVEEFDRAFNKPKIVTKMKPTEGSQSELSEGEDMGIRPQRTSKQKALNQVKAWCGDITEGEDAKRKFLSDDDDSSDSFEKKMKMEEDTDTSEDEKPQVTYRKVIRTPGSVNGVSKKPEPVFTPSATQRVVRVNQKQLPHLSSGVYIMSKADGIIKLDSTTTSAGSPLLKVGQKIGQTHIKVVKKDPIPAGITVKTSTPIRPKLIKASDIKQPIATSAPKVITKVVQPRRTYGAAQRRSNEHVPPPPVEKLDESKLTEEEESDGVEEMDFPTDLPLPSPDSPPGDFTLCPLTGKVLGQSDEPEINDQEDTATSLDVLVKQAVSELSDVDMVPPSANTIENTPTEDVPPETDKLVENSESPPIPPLVSVSSAVATSSSTSITALPVVSQPDPPTAISSADEHTTVAPTNRTPEAKIATKDDIEERLMHNTIEKEKGKDVPIVKTRPAGSSILSAALTNAMGTTTPTRVGTSNPSRVGATKKLLSTTPQTIRQKITPGHRTPINSTGPRPTTTIIHKITPGKNRPVMPKTIVHQEPTLNRSSKVTTYKPANVARRIGNTTIYKTSEKPRTPNIVKSTPVTPQSQSAVIQSTSTVISMPLLTPDEEPAQENAASLNEISPLVSIPENSSLSDLSTFTLPESETPLLITGDDGTIYQVAGQNEDGQTILISEGPDGQQQCVLVSSETTAEEAPTLMMDAAPSETSELEQALLVNPQPEETVTEGADAEGESEESQVVAQIIKADPPSPGGTRKVVLMLPDGNLMMTDVTAEQYAALELDK